MWFSQVRSRRVSTSTFLLLQTACVMSWGDHEGHQKKRWRRKRWIQQVEAPTQQLNRTAINLDVAGQLGSSRRFRAATPNIPQRWTMAGSMILLQCYRDATLMLPEQHQQWRTNWGRCCSRGFHHRVAFILFHVGGCNNQQRFPIFFFF